MKKEFKISTLSIVCVLCTAIAMPSFGASAVRSLGGVGTYSSASNAATAGSKSTSDTSASMRAGSLRVGDTKAATTSTRAAATPRLSIGKYLAGSSAIGTGSTSGTIKPGQSGNNHGVEGRVAALEEALGLGDYKGNFGGLVVDVEALADDLQDLTGTAITSVEYEDGKLTVVQNGKEIDFDLATDFAGKSEVEALQDAIDAIVAPNLDDYAKKTDLEGFLTSAGLADLENAVAALELADESMEDAIAALQGGMLTEKDLAAKVAELNAVDKGLQDAIDALENAFPSTEGLVNKDYVDGLIASLQSADEALQSSIDAIEKPDVNKAYVDNAINGLNTTIAELQSADAEMAQAIANLESALANAATKDELQTAKSELQDAIDAIDTGNIDLTNYYTKAEAEEKFAAKTDVAANATNIAELTASVQSAASDAADAKLAAGTAQNMADLNAEEIEAIKAAGYVTSGALTEYVKQASLAAVATTGSYDDLLDKPDLTQYVTESQVETSVNTAINAYEIPDGSITAEKLQNGAVTSDKINTGMNAGEMVMLMSNGDGTSSWVSVTVDAE